MEAAINIKADRLWQRLETLAEITDPARPWTRRAFTDRYLDGRAWLQGEMEAAGLTTRLDAAGNLVGSLPGSEAGLAPLVTGSHIDTVASGGRYDGMLGVLAGLEAIQSMREAGITLRHPIEVIDFLSEEPSEYGVSCIGSRGMVGMLTSDMLDFQEPGGERLGDAIRRMGGVPEALSAPLRQPDDLAAFVELHIEQGRVLEDYQLPIGVVSGIVGIYRYAIVVTGQADHAGTTPMDLRHDALATAARLIENIQTEARHQSQGDAYLVATVGRLDVSPNASNAIPDCVKMVLEVRSDDAGLLEEFFPPLLEQAQHDAKTQGTDISATSLSKGLPTRCDDAVQAHIAAAAAALGLDTLTLPSGAGHDAVYMAKLCPTGMIFTPCLAGRSHCPEESMTPQQAAEGCQVLLATLLRLDDELDSAPTS